MLGHGQQRVGIRREIDPDDLGALVRDMIDETGVLVRETVVILPPNVRCQKIIQRRNRTPPGYIARRLQPFRVLIEHRVHDMNKALVA